MPLTTYGDHKALASIFSSGTPATLYVGLSTTTVAEDGTGYTEPSTAGTAYARVAVDNSIAGAKWTISDIALGSGGGAQVVNAATIPFPTSTAAWGNCTYHIITDSATVGAGNVYGYGLLTAAQNVGTNNTVSFAAGQLDINAV